MDHDTFSRPRDRDRDEHRGSDPFRDSRRRSPDRRRDRRRSRSPQPQRDIDRYQPERLPRDDYHSSRGRDDGYRERRRSSPHSSANVHIDRYVPGMEDTDPPKLLVNPMPDPLKLDFQVGFTWFAAWWREERRVKEEKERQRTGKPAARLKGDRESREDRDADRPKIQAAYDEYKEKLQKSQAQAFVRSHKNEDWFRERYVPEARDAFRRNLMDYRQSLFAQWEQDLSSGVFDEFTLEGIYKSESNGLGGVLEKEEGEASAAAEVLMPGDLVPTKGGDIRDSAAEQPTLLIKTVAPTVSREKLETFAKELLGEGEGGFAHLSLSDPNPLKRCHRMGWIVLHPESQQDEIVEDATNRADEEDGEADGDAMKSEHTTRTPSTTAKALEKINGKTVEDTDRGNFTVHCGVHRSPDAPRKKALWDLFSAPERIARDLDLAVRLVRKLDNELGEDIFGVAKIEERVQYLAERGLLQPAEKTRMTKDFDMDVEDGEDAEDEGMIDEDETDDEELLIKKKKLDLLVEYLRRVFNLCFFCVFESDSVHELQRKCPGGHLRRPRNSLTSAAKEVAQASALGEPFPLKKSASKTEARDVDAGLDTIAEDGEMAVDAESPVEEKKFTAMKPSARTAQQLQRAFNWVKTYEEKILQWLEPENINIRKLGGVPLEEGVDEELAKHVMQEDTNKYRCKVPDCTKLFKGLDFWRKHVEKRHSEWYERTRAEIALVNTYVLDPAHIIPSRSDANSNGHFPLGGAITASTPRNFQLNQHLPMGFPPASGMPNTMNPVFHGAMGMGFAPNMNMAAMPGMPMGIGPIRNQGRNTMNGRYAPYDTRRRAPSTGGGRPGGVPAFPGMTGALGEGGAGAMGPPEATLNRTLRTYEDLDAADRGQGTTELDY